MLPWLSPVCDAILTFTKGLQSNEYNLENSRIIMHDVVEYIQYKYEYILWAMAE